VTDAAQRATARLTAAAERFRRITFATGFGVEGCVVLDLIGRHRLPIDVFTLDTGVFFAETHALWRRLEDRYGLTIRAVRAAEPVEDGLWERDPDACCHARKVVPLRRELARFDAWITAIRRDQTLDRASALPVEDDARFGLVKINPLVDWTAKDIWGYVLAFDVPYNPLHDQGYPSIGCQPCTVPVALGEDPRAGRWRGRTKTECGLHTKEP
jgi:phosphoadenylyl-sulfate reductase (thioredoxin)